MTSTKEIFEMASLNKVNKNQITKQIYDRRVKELRRRERQGKPRLEVYEILKKRGKKLEDKNSLSEVIQSSKHHKVCCCNLDCNFLFLFSV